MKKILILIMLAILMPKVMYARCHRVVMDKWGIHTRGPILSVPYILETEKSYNIIADANMENIDVYIYNERQEIIYYENINHLNANEPYYINIDLSSIKECDIKISQGNKYIWYKSIN